MPGYDLVQFVKGLLGFYGEGADSVLSPLILAAKKDLELSGVNEPDGEDEQEAALYNTAVALSVKIVHDGDPKGSLQRALTGIVLKTKDYGGEEVDTT